MLFQNFGRRLKQGRYGTGADEFADDLYRRDSGFDLLRGLRRLRGGRVRSRWNRAVFHVMVLSMMVPGIINTVPLYIIMRKINGINSHWAMMLLLACQCLPFSVFLYEGFIRSMNQSVEEAAVIDGCTKFSAFWRVTFPLLKPITPRGDHAGVGIWNNYAQAVFFLQNQNYHTLPLAISTFFQTYGADYTCLQPARSSVWRRWCWCLFYSRSSSSRD